MLTPVRRISQRSFVLWPRREGADAIMTDLKVMSWPGKFRPASPLSAGIRGGDTLWLSGQVPIDPDSGEVTSGSIEAQTEKVFDNLERLLAAEDCGLERVVRCTVFLTSQADFAGMNAVYRKRLKEPYPARSTLIVAALANTAYRVEIDAIAIAGKGPAA
jgi:2-iminobutanoate/2-iminopropanoate deaminase